MDSHTGLSTQILNNPDLSQKLLDELVPIIYSVHSREDVGRDPRCAVPDAEPYRGEGPDEDAGPLLTAHKADWVCLHVGRRPVILYLRRDGSVPVAGVVVDHVLFVERLLPVQDV